MKRFGSRRPYVFVAVVFAGTALLQARIPPSLRNPNGLQLLVAPENTQPELLIVVPGVPHARRAIEVLFPEHVTVRKHGSADAQQLYLFRPGKQGNPTVWRQTGPSLQYEKDLQGGIHLLARATLQSDGVLFHYELENHSDISYDMATAVTDPRLMSVFHDVRLERTYVHTQNGFELLASETPARLTMPLKQWLPSRYMASYAWPVPAHLVERHNDGITYYNRSRPVDEPFIATVSEDHQWVVASFTRTTGNIWSNPELTCQHVDQDAPLPSQGKAVLEVKILILHASLDEVLKKVVAQRFDLD